MVARMLTEDGHCTTCRHKTTWEVHKGYQRCQGCRERFPCAKGCLHVDCREKRGEVDTCPVCKTYKPIGAACEMVGCAAPERKTNV
jgi:hypothetical protein